MIKSKGDTELTLDHTFNEPLSNIPENVTTIELGMMFDREIRRGDLPEGLRKLRLGHSFNQPMSLPDSVEELSLGTRFNRVMDFPLPRNLTVLKFGERFNSNIMEGVLPKNLRELSFGMMFNVELTPGVLPRNLEYLDLGTSYKHRLIAGALPPKLKTLILSFSYNEPIDEGVLPNGLLEIQFGEKFNRPLGRGVLPRSLRKLKFGYDFDQSLKRIPNVTELHLGDGYNRILKRGDIPDSVKILSLGFEYNRVISPGVLPENIEELTFGKYSERLLVGSIPGSVRNLNLGISYNHALTPGILPTGIKRLVLSNLYSHIILKGHIPDGVEELVFGNSYNLPISPDVLPSSLRSIVFGDGFNQPLPQNTLPPHLSQLRFGIGFDSELRLPGGLERLHLGAGFGRDVTLPPFLQELRLGPAFKNRYISIPDTLVNLSIDDVSVDPSVYVIWVETMRIMTPDRLEKLYHAGIPVPVSPHKKSQLPINPDDLHKIIIFSTYDVDHYSYIRSLKYESRNLLRNWIYKDYYKFNLFISNLNMGERTSYDDEDFVSDFMGDASEIGSAAISAYHDLRTSIINAPRANHKIYAWRGLHGMMDICTDLDSGDHIAFTRFMACSISQEVSCKFAREGVLMLIELPPYTPILDITKMKQSEPEFVLPDRTIFQVTGRAPGRACGDMTCSEIIRIRLVGLYTETPTGEIVMEDGLGNGPEMINIRRFF